MSAEHYPAAGIFPLLAEPELRELAEDIKQHGQRLPIVVWKDFVVDGRNRLAACEMAGVEPWIEERDFEDDASAVRFIVSVNLKRRHLDSGQRSAIAARLENLPAHRPGKGANLHTSRDEAAALLNVSRRSVASARKVLDSGDASLVAAVDAGKVAVSTAAELATLPKEEQAAVVARGDEEILAKAKEIRGEKRAKEPTHGTVNARPEDVEPNPFQKLAPRAGHVDDLIEDFLQVGQWREKLIARPHPSKPGKYQIARGHAVWFAMLVVRDLFEGTRLAPAALEMLTEVVEEERDQVTSLQDVIDKYEAVRVATNAEAPAASALEKKKKARA